LCDFHVAPMSIPNHWTYYRYTMKKKLLYSLIGLLLTLWSPFSTLLLLWFSPRAALEITGYIDGAMKNHLHIFVLSLAVAGLFFPIYGFFLGRRIDAMTKKNSSLNHEVLTDPLTGLGNHRFLHEKFQREFHKHQDSKQPLSCLMMDLDHFKQINDDCGHPFGDHVLECFAQVLKNSIREGDMASRYGGEEFLVVLPDCGEEEVKRVAERIRQETEKCVLSHCDKPVSLTVSLGAVTSYESEGFNYRQLIALSDRALYDAKAKGRNQLIQTSLRTAAK
jgi:diguanylate cyclase (GGDEF)-like protein